MAFEIPLANWNGKECPLNQVMIPATDRGFLFGDSIYEVIRIYSGKLWLFNEHWQRLSRCLQELEMNCNIIVLEEQLLQTLKNSKIDDGMAYVQISRGEAPRQHSFDQLNARANTLIYIQALDRRNTRNQQVRGIKVVTQDELRWGRCDLKTTNLLGNCLASTRAKRSSAFEAVFVDHEGCLSEGSHTNFFAVTKAGVLRTAPLSPRILPGITRAKVLQLAQKVGLRVIERPLHKNELKEVSEAFLTGTSTEVMPISQIDEMKLGDPGPQTKQLINAYDHAVDQWLKN